MERVVGAEIRQTDAGQVTGTDWGQESLPRRVSDPNAAV